MPTPPVSPSETTFLPTCIREKVRVSFEFFPPQTTDMLGKLDESLRRLAPLKPNFVSVTYGAGGSTRDRTHETVCRIQRDYGLTTAAHLTCVGSSRAEIGQIAQTYWQSGIRHIVALRGDLPINEGYSHAMDGYAHADDLIRGLRAIAPFDISVAVFPEKHPESVDFAEDIETLKRKIDAGATRAITQFFLDPTVFCRFRDRVHGAGLSIPLIPGILPITNFSKARLFAEKCGASVPAWCDDLFAGLDNDPETRSLVASTFAVHQCQTLYHEGVRDFHFYTLNRAALTVAICRVLGVSVQQEKTEE